MKYSEISERLGFEVDRDECLYAPDHKHGRIIDNFITNTMLDCSDVIDCFNYHMGDSFYIVETNHEILGEKRKYLVLKTILHKNIVINKNIFKRIREVLNFNKDIYSVLFLTYHRKSVELHGAMDANHFVYTNFLRSKFNTNEFYLPNNTVANVVYY